MAKWEFNPELIMSWSPKFAWLITSGPLLLCKISSRYDYPFPPNIGENAHQHTVTFRLRCAAKYYNLLWFWCFSSATLLMSSLEDFANC